MNCSCELKGKWTRLHKQARRGECLESSASTAIIAHGHFVCVFSLRQQWTFFSCKRLSSKKIS